MPLAAIVASMPTDELIRPPRTEKELLDRGLREVTDRLPAGWTARAARQAARDIGRADLIVDLAGPSGKRATLVFEAKSVAYPRDLRGAIQQLRRFSALGAPVFVAPFLGPQARSMLADEDVGYIDLTGNLRITLSSPALFLSDRGADTNPWPERGQVRSLAGARAGRLVRALCDVLPPYGVSDLAALTGLTAGYVSKVLAVLVREDLVERAPRGPVVSVAWPRLLEAWARDYGLLTSNVARLFLAPRGVEDVVDKLRDLPAKTRSQIAITGSPAAARVAPVAPTTKLCIYAEDALRLAERLGLVPADTVGNVFLLEPFDDVVFARTTDDAGIGYVAPSQAAVDCLTGPDRMPEEGRAVLAWMERNERAWRTSPSRRTR